MHDVYQPPDQGPFRCNHCQHARVSATVCVDDEAVRAIGAQHPWRRRPDGRLTIEPYGCCDFYKKAVA